MTLGDFSNQAGAYSRSRPGYPITLIQKIMKHANVSANDPVAELGAGTGLLTSVLSELELHIDALEPNEDMRRNAPEILNVSWSGGTFEETKLDSDSIDWIVAAQAFHWAKPEIALPEMKRILKPNKCFTVLWNNRSNEKNPIVLWTRELIRKLVPDFSHAYRDEDWEKVLTSTDDFTDVFYAEEDHVVPMSRDRFLDLWRSHNRLNTIAGPDRFRDFITQLEAYLEREDVGVVEVPYCCRSWTAVRT